MRAHFVDPNLQKFPWSGAYCGWLLFYGFEMILRAASTYRAFPFVMVEVWGEPETRVDRWAKMGGLIGLKS